MSTNHELIDALETVLRHDADNLSLRLRLASILMEAGRASEALQHCVELLNRQPDHLEALDLAQKAATASGDSRRAASYERLRAAMSESPAEGEKAATPAPPIQAANVPDQAPEHPSSEEQVTLRLFAAEPDDDAVYAELPKITLADVAGMEKVKQRLNLAFLAPMRNPELLKMYGRSLRGGLLLYGPPGCGKTFFARATAGELGAKFISVGLSDVLNMYLGQSEHNLHGIFESARRNRPCVLFFDEIDALGRKRSLMRESAGRDVVNQLLSELDGVTGNNEGLFVMAATNHPWDVDSALRRPGRLDRMLLVLPPDRSAREAIARSCMADRPVQSIDYPHLAVKTEQYSCADVVHLCDSAAELAMESYLTTGTVRPILQQDFNRALQEIKPSTRAWFETARNYALFANDGGAYDELLEYLRAHRLA